MGKKELVDSTTRVPAEIRKSFGPPPVLNSDDIKIHDAILCGLAQAVKPRDFFEWMYLHDLADVSYQIQWLRRLKVALIRQSHKENLERFAANVTAVAALEKQRLRDRADREAETKLKAEIDKIDAKTQAKLKSLEGAEDGPVDEAGLFVSWIGCYERTERLLATAEMRRSAILKELDDHRQGLGQRLRHACDEIIDGDFDEVVVPPQEGSAPPAPTPNAVVETAVILATSAPTPSVPAASIAPSAQALNPAGPAGPASDPVTPTETATSISDTPTIPIKSITSRPTQGPPNPPDKTVTSGTQSAIPMPPAGPVWPRGGECSITPKHAVVLAGTAAQEGRERTAFDGLAAALGALPPDVPSSALVKLDRVGAEGPLPVSKPAAPPPPNQEARRR